MQTETAQRAVRIYRRNGSWVIDTAGREQPMAKMLSPYVPAGSRATIARSYHIEDALTNGINPQIITAALSAYYTEHPNSSANPDTGVQQIVVAEGSSDLPDNMAYLAFGDNLYRMVAVRRIGNAKAIRAMREKARQEVESFREGLRAQAAREAESVIQQANVRATAVRQEAERLLTDARAGVRFPVWCTGLTVTQDTCNQQYVLKKCPITFTGISYMEKQWATLRDETRSRVVHVDLWLPLNGNPEMVHMYDTSKGYLPHINNSACMKIGEEVLAVNSIERLERFRLQIIRAMSIINLASLLAPNYETWLPEIVKLIPDPIKAWLAIYRTNGAQHRDQARLALPPAENLETGAETWNLIR